MELNCILCYCIVSYCISLVLHCIAWYCMVLHGIAWYCKMLHCIARCCIVLYGIALYRIKSYGIAWYCMVLHCTRLDLARHIFTLCIFVAFATCNLMYTLFTTSDTIRTAHASIFIAEKQLLYLALWKDFTKEK